MQNGHYTDNYYYYTYLDHAGTTVYSKTQVDNYHKDLLTNLCGNPHTQNPSSLQSTEIMEYVRNLVLNHFEM